MACEQIPMVRTKSFTHPPLCILFCNGNIHLNHTMKLDLNQSVYNYSVQLCRNNAILVIEIVLSTLFFAFQVSNLCVK